MIGSGGDLLAPTRINLLKRLVPARLRDRGAFGVAVAAASWMPLLVLSLVNRSSAASGGVVPFIADISIHTRFLIALPLLLAARPNIRERLESVVDYFAASEIVDDSDQERYLQGVRRFVSLRDASGTDLSITVLAYLASLALAVAAVRSGMPSWFSDGSGTVGGITPAGWWYTVFSQPIWTSVLLGWVWRIFLWWRLLSQLARLDLRLLPTHPDRAGGLGILETGQTSFAILFLGSSTILAGNLAQLMVNDGTPLAAAAPTIAVYLVICLVVVMGPLARFLGPLRRTKRLGLVKYGDLGDSLFRAFDEKWSPLDPLDQRGLLGDPDPSSLADYGYAYEVVSSMRVIPFSRGGLVTVVLLTLAPFAPLLLLKYSVSEILEGLLGILG